MPAPATPERYLRPDQNLFDQLPYIYLEVVAQERELELRRLKLSLPLIHGFEIRVGLAGLPDEGARQVIGQNIGRIGERVEEAARMQITGRVKSPNHQPLPQFYVWQKTFAEIALYFKDYPSWYEYLREFTSQQQPWRPTGEPKKNFRPWLNLQFPTYSQYLIERSVRQEEQVARDARIRRLAILQVLTETFPQDFSIKTALQPPTIGQKTRKGRDWRGLVSSGLRDERRHPTQKLK